MSEVGWRYKNEAGSPMRWSCADVSDGKAVLVVFLSAPDVWGGAGGGRPSDGELDQEPGGYHRDGRGVRGRAPGFSCGGRSAADGSRGGAGRRLRGR
jgi:hypothetical protein